MKDKGFLKFKGNESKGVLNYIKYNDDIVSLTQIYSRKVRHIKTEKNIDIAIGLLSRDFNKTKVDIIDNSQTVKEVFDYMLSQKHTHYKKEYKDLVVLKFALSE
jgi:hypothetical protein